VDAGLHGMEFEAPGRIASTVGKRRGKPSEKPENQGNPAFLFRIVKFADLAGIKSDRLLVVQALSLLFGVGFFAFWEGVRAYTDLGVGLRCGAGGLRKGRARWRYVLAQERSWTYPRHSGRISPTIGHPAK